MTDTGMMAAILRWQFEKVRLDGSLNGKLLETFVFNQLAAIVDAQEDDCHLYHYRDREQREIDFVVENDDGEILGIEVKAGSVVSKDMFRHLEWFREKISPNQPFTGIVFYTGENVLSFGNRLWAVPIASMWS